MQRTHISHPISGPFDEGYDYTCEHCEHGTHEPTVACDHPQCQASDLCEDCRDLCDLCSGYFCPEHIIRAARPDGKAPDVICRACVERIFQAAA